MDHVDLCSGPEHRVIDWFFRLRNEGKTIVQPTSKHYSMFFSDWRIRFHNNWPRGTLENWKIMVKKIAWNNFFYAFLKSFSLSSNHIVQNNWIIEYRFYTSFYAFRFQCFTSCAHHYLKSASNLRINDK